MKWKKDQEIEVDEEGSKNDESEDEGVVSDYDDDGEDNELSEKEVEDTMRAINANFK